jgi:hypothetical protein
MTLLTDIVSHTFKLLCTITLGRPTATVGQKSIWVGQAIIWIGHRLPGLIAGTAPGHDRNEQLTTNNNYSTMKRLHNLFRFYNL